MKIKTFSGFKLLVILLIVLFSTGISYSETPFSKDTDHDGFPDDLEKGTRNNPRVNQALQKSFKAVAGRKGGKKCSAIKKDLLTLGRPHNILIILDISGSMSSPLGSVSRMEIAKKILKKYVDALPSSMKFGFVIYGKASCGDDSVELVAPIGSISKSTLKDKIDSLSPTGLTPIAMTFDKCHEYLKGFEKDNNNIILISDGMESCGGNPVQAIKRLKETPSNPDVTVIGLGVRGRVGRHLKKIADAVKGKYASVNKEEDFVKAFAGFFNKMSRFYKDIVCINSQFNSYLQHETHQYNRSKAWLVNKKMLAKGDMKDILAKVEEQIEENHKARVEAKDKLNQLIKNKMEEMKSFLTKFVGSD